MKTILFFAGSNSSKSINKQLVDYASSLLDKANSNVIDLRDFDVPIYSEDLEKDFGTHPNIQKLVDLIDNVDALVVGTPEHNGSTSAFFKNILDWLSRVKKVSGREEQYLNGKPLLVISASGGRGGAAKARDYVKTVLGHADPKAVYEFGLPQFYENFKEGKVVNEDLNSELKSQLNRLEEF